MKIVVCVYIVLTDIDLKSIVGLFIFLFHFRRQSVGWWLFFGRQCFFIAWPLVHEGSMVGVEVLSHPLRAPHASN